MSLISALQGLIAHEAGSSEVLPDGLRQVSLKGIRRTEDTAFLFGLNGRRAPVVTSEARAEGEDAPAAGGSSLMVEGIASSTSQDWYGTEMSLNALNSMVDQCKSSAGVPLLPTHGSWIAGPPEWDCVVGKSVDATVQRADVVAPAEGAENEPHYTMTVTSQCYDIEKTRDLFARLDAGQVIGQSIGGWFTDVRVIYDDEGDIKRIIIDDVKLDHIALTRMPANPDSIGIARLRSKLADAFRLDALEARSAANRESVTPEPSAPDLVAETRATGNDANNADAPAPAEQEPDMTPEQIQEIITRSIEAANAGLPETIRAATVSAVEPIKTELADLRTRMDRIEGQRSALPTPAEPARTVDAGGKVSEIEALRSELADTRALLASVAEAPNRRGIHLEGRAPTVTAGPGADASFRSLVSECRSRKHGTALATVVERHIDVISETERPANINNVGSARSLTNILAAGLRAAEADGLINRAGSLAQWS